MRDSTQSYYHYLVMSVLYILDSQRLISFFMNFSPPFIERDLQQTGLTAELTVYCLESSTTIILPHLQNALENQNERRFFVNAILQVQYPGEKRLKITLIVPFGLELIWFTN